MDVTKFILSYHVKLINVCGVCVLLVFMIFLYIRSNNFDIDGIIYERETKLVSDDRHQPGLSSGEDIHEPPPQAQRMLKTKLCKLDEYVITI